MTTVSTEVTPTDLPVWMRRAMRRTDWGILLALALSLAAAWPFLVLPGLPRTNASEAYVFQTDDLTTMLGEGRLYPRWSPNALLGYGAPIPNYYPPGASYSAALVNLFVLGDAVTALRLIYTAALMLAGGAVFALVNRRAGPAPALLASTLYVFSPYVGLTAPHLLGDLPGMAGLALMPALLWTTDRHMTNHYAADFALTGVITAALVVTDPRSAVAGAGLSLLLALWHWNPAHTRTLASWLLATALGVCMSAFYWLPALAERQLVAWLPSTRGLEHSLTLHELFLPLQRVDLAEIVAAPRFALGAPLVLATGASLFVMLRDRRFGSFASVFTVTGLLLALAGVVAFPRQTWLVAPVSLCLALGSSQLWSLHRALTHRLALSAVLVAVLALALPVWTPPRWNPSFGSTSPTAQIEYERDGFGVATLPPGAPVPSTVSPLLGPSRNLINSYETGAIDKLGGLTSDSTTQIGALSHATHADLFQVRAMLPASIDILTAYFPGWEAWLGARQLPLVRQPDTGLITVSVPSGAAGELVVVLNATPTRRAAWALTWAGAGALLALAWWHRRRQTTTFTDIGYLTLPQVRLAALVSAGFWLLTLTVLPSPQPLLYAQPGSGLDNSFALRNRTNAGLEALAYRLDDRRYSTGDTVDLTLYWRALRPLTDNLQARAGLVLIDPGIVFETTPLRHPGGYPTRRWATGSYATDRYTLEITEDMPTGDYRVAVEVFRCEPDCDSESRLTFFAPEGTSLGQTLLLPAFIRIE